MKRYLSPALFAAFFFGAILALRAHDDGTNDECNINGTEQMDAVVILNPTDTAPAGATGIAKIDSENDDGNESAHIDLKTIGLAPGDYDLIITLQSTGSNVDLGTFTAGGNNDGENDGEGDNGGDDQGEHGGEGNGFHHDGFGHGWISCNWGGFTNWGCWTNWTDTNFVSTGFWANWLSGDGGPNPGCGTNGTTITRTETDLPADVNPTDIAEITVADSSGNPILVGDLVNPAPGTVVNISGSVQVTPGSGSTVSGTAHVQSTASKGKWKHQFTLNANGATAKSTFKLDVNGKVSGGARSSKSGQMTIKKLPSHTPALRSLKLIDAHGNVAASAKF